MDALDRPQLQGYLEIIREDLDSTMNFWIRHSHDQVYGGFFNCLDKDGEVFDETKYGWMQGRQVWSYAKLYNEFPRFRTEEIHTAIERGCDFLHYLKDPATWRCYFSVTRTGQPIKLQKTIYTECFYLMGLSEASKALKKPSLQEEAVEMMSKVVYWAREDDSLITGRRLSGQEPVSTLGVPMMLMCCVRQLVAVDPSLVDRYEELVDWAIDQLLMHSKREGCMILENVSPDGLELPGTLGRRMMPGHSIECGWFLLEIGKQRQDNMLIQRAINEFILAPLEHGWDKKNGGLFYKLDAEEKPLPDLDWNMKHWWPHNEAMIATLMAFDHTKDQQLLEAFDTVFCYAYKYFYDKSGEWFGYLNQQGDVNQELKGGPFKGCFHVPRCLLMCEQMLSGILQA